MTEIDGGLRSLFRTHLKPRIHWQSIESAITGGGTPDLNGCSLGVEFWVEMKKTEGWTVTMEVPQIGWHLCRARHGGRTFIAVRRRCDAGKRRPAADELWLLPGIAAAEARRLGLRLLPPALVLGRWTGGPSAWDWDAVRRLLTA